MKARKRKNIMKEIKVHEAIFLSGIPLFGFFSAFVNSNQQVELLEIVSNKIYTLLILFLSSLFCAISVLSVDRLREIKTEGSKAGETYILSSALYLVISIILASIFNPKLSIFPPLIYFNWIIYYEIRKVIEFPDVLLHLSGGILQFFFGVYFANGFLNSEVFLLSLFVSLAFTGGYISDLAEDIEEDRRIGQKNFAEKIGRKKSLVLSFLFFLAGYMLGFYLAYKGFFPKWIIGAATVIHLTSLLLTVKSKIVIPTYRLIYRGIFTICGFAFLFHNFHFV